MKRRLPVHQAAFYVTDRREDACGQVPVPLSLDSQFLCSTCRQGLCFCAYMLPISQVPALLSPLVWLQAALAKLRQELVSAGRLSPAEKAAHPVQCLSASRA